MLKFAVKSLKDGEVFRQLDIDCDEETPESIKRGLYAEKAIDEQISLAYADLRGANLRGADQERF